MKYSTRLSGAIHVLALIAINKQETLSSDEIAYSAKTNPAQIRKTMATLKKHQIIVSTVGHPLPKLARDAKDITLLDVYKAVEGDTPLLHLDTNTNPECGKGIFIQDSLKEYYDLLQEKIEKEMSYITLQDILNSYNQKADSISLL